MEADDLFDLTSRIERAMDSLTAHREVIKENMLAELSIDRTFVTRVADEAKARAAKVLRDTLKSAIDEAVKYQIDQVVRSINWYPIIQSVVQPLIEKTIAGLNLSGRSLTQHIVSEVSKAVIPLVKPEGENNG